MTKRKPTRARGLGVTDEGYSRMLAAQSGCCAICGNPPKKGGRRLNVDHNHRTGKVRGLLCHRCNRCLPTYVTSDWLRAALAYVLRDEHPEYSRDPAPDEDVPDQWELAR